VVNSLLGYAGTSDQAVHADALVADIHARLHPLVLQGALPALQGWRLLFGYFTVAVVLSEKVQCPSYRCCNPKVAEFAPQLKSCYRVRINQ
jgi:hypothetical protein